jgi:small subunit ribosomal protein S21
MGLLLTQSTNSTSLFQIQNQILIFAIPLKGGISGIMIIINVKDGESLDKALKRFKKKFEKTGVLRELRSRQAFEKKSITRRHEIKHAIYKQNMNLDTNV